MAGAIEGCCGNASWRGRLCQYHEGYSDGVAVLTDNLEAFIKLVYPGEMTPNAKRILEAILESHAARTKAPRG